MSKRTDLINAYNLTEKTEKDRALLNLALEAIGEEPLLDLTEEERAAKKEREDAEECIAGTGLDAETVPEHYPTYDPEHKGQWVQVKDKRAAWRVHYNERGYEDDCEMIRY